MTIIVNGTMMKLSTIATCSLLLVGCGATPNVAVSAKPATTPGAYARRETAPDYTASRKAIARLEALLQHAKDPFHRSVARLSLARHRSAVGDVDAAWGHVEHGLQEKELGRWPELIVALDENGQRDHAAKLADALAKRFRTSDDLVAIGRAVTTIGDFDRTKAIIAVLRAGPKVRGSYSAMPPHILAAERLELQLAAELVKHGRDDEAAAVIPERIVTPLVDGERPKGSDAWPLLRWALGDDALLARCAYLLGTNDFDGAEALLPTMKYDFSRVTGATLISKALLERGDRERARNVVKRQFATAVADESRGPKLLRIAAKLELVDDVRRAARERPSRSTIRALAEASCARPDDGEAAVVEYMDEAIKLLDDDDARRRMYRLLDIGRTCGLRGDRTTAARLLRLAEELAPKVDEADREPERVAELHAAAGLLEQAMQLTAALPNPKKREAVYTAIAYRAAQQKRADVFADALQRSGSPSSRLATWARVVRDLEGDDQRLDNLAVSLEQALIAEKPPADREHDYPVSTDPASYQSPNAAERAVQLRGARKADVSQRDLDWLEQAIRHGQFNTRQFASAALARHAPTRALALFVELGVDDFQDAIIELGPLGIDHVLEQIEERGLDLLGTIALTLVIERHADHAKAARAVPVLLRAIVNEDKRMQVTAARGLGAFGKDAERLILAHSKAPNVEVRRGAVRALKRLDGRSDKGDRAIEAAKNDRDESVRAEANK